MVVIGAIVLNNANKQSKIVDNIPNNFIVKGASNLS
ncbi:hypothetical protein ERHA54_31980 [Erwinia rhapontici]|uniref:Uncharacterized protein n=1 Tax=Erwinia rhapontici TaxID=55212 RepID=A0ABN6DMD5_ERWRD|nr:hypothetical protein [Erwinia rhapontici]TDT01970.1 hypothetical protein EDF84_101700 [Erwinia rhapontici]BCQ35687.1 hypothetical protein ERHA53_30300 [Erwinia rhapontici]BCQ40595.1 hypothetical protein ERHA54_31980 [Erwinia rhapontici]BCQ45876.1 hypothetical protein ERHA55_34030 [Erwinia rhapontici]